MDVRQGLNSESDRGQCEDRGHTTEAIYSGSDHDYERTRQTGTVFSHVTVNVPIQR